MRYAMKNGVLVPEPPKPKPPTQQELHDAYYKLHSVCPWCGSDGIEKTCVGYHFNSLETASDSNRAWCKCGWRGIAHDLVEKKQ